MKSFLAKMSSREKVLAGLVAGTLFVLLNLFAVGFFLKKQSALNVEIAAKHNQLELAQKLVSERNLWEQRDEWLRKAQPPLENTGSAAVDLLDQVKEIAKTHGVNILNPTLGSIEQAPNQKSVFVALETKSAWSALIGFLYEMQRPDRFVVLEKAGLEIDSSDAAQIRGAFKVARWYKP